MIPKLEVMAIQCGTAYDIKSLTVKKLRYLLQALHPMTPFYQLTLKLIFRSLVHCHMAFAGYKSNVTSTELNIGLQKWIVQGTQKWHWNYSKKPGGFNVMGQNH